MTDVLTEGLQGITYPEPLINFRRKLLDNQLLSLISSLTQRTCCDIETCVPEPPQILRDIMGPTLDESVRHGLGIFRKLFGYSNDEDPLAKEEDLWLNGEYAALDEEEATFGSNDNTRNRRKLLNRLSILLKKRRKLGFPCKCCRGLKCSKEEENSTQEQHTEQPVEERAPSISSHAEIQNMGTVSKTSKTSFSNRDPSEQTINEGDTTQDVTALEKVSSHEITNTSSSRKSTNEDNLSYVTAVEKLPPQEIKKTSSSNKSIREDDFPYPAQDVGKEIRQTSLSNKSIREDDLPYPAQDVGKVPPQEIRRASLSNKSIREDDLPYPGQDVGKEIKQTSLSNKSIREDDLPYPAQDVGKEIKQASLSNKSIREDDLPYPAQDVGKVPPQEIKQASLTIKSTCGDGRCHPAQNVTTAVKESSQEKREKSGSSHKSMCGDDRCYAAKFVASGEKFASQGKKDNITFQKSMCGDDRCYAAQVVASGEKFASQGKKDNITPQKSMCGDDRCYAAQVVASGEKFASRGRKDIISQKSTSPGSFLDSAHDFGDDKISGIPGVIEESPIVAYNRDSQMELLTVQIPNDFTSHSDLNLSTCSESCKKDGNELPRWLIPRVNYNDNKIPDFSDEVFAKPAGNVSHKNAARTDPRNQVAACTRTLNKCISTYPIFQEFQTSVDTQQISNKTVNGEISKQLRSPVTKAKSTTAYYKKKCFCKSEMISLLDIIMKTGRCKCERKIASELKLKDKNDPSLLSTNKCNFAEYCRYFETVCPAKPSGILVGTRDVSVKPTKELKPEKNSNSGVESKSMLGIFSDVNIRLSSKRFNEFEGNKFENILPPQAETSPNKAASSSRAKCSCEVNGSKKKIVSNIYDDPFSKNKCKGVGPRSVKYDQSLQVNQRKKISTNRPRKIFWCSVRLNMIPERI